MDNNKEIKLIVQLKTRFVSINSLYKARVNFIGGKPIGTIYKNPKAVEVEREIREQLRSLDFSEYIDWLKNTNSFNLHIQFIFKKNITNCDTSNYFKNIEDIWTRFVKEDLGVEGYDDRLHTEISAVKSIIPKSKHEYACISLKESKFNVRFDLKELPTGVCYKIYDESSEEELKKLLKTNKLDYINYDEMINNGTTTYNVKLFLISPKDINVVSTSEIINSIWNCLLEDSGFIWICITNDDNTKEIGDFLKIISETSKGNSRIKLKSIKTLEEIF